jgi:hypothetical protein
MSSRVSARIKHSRKIHNDDDAFIDHGTKKRKIPKLQQSNVENSWQRPRGRGKLKMLPEMPVDILLEVRPPTQIRPTSLSYPIDVFTDFQSS